MESNTIKMHYFDKIEIGRSPFKDDFFGYLLTLVMDVVSDNELSKDDTIEVINVLNEELQKC